MVKLSPRAVKYLNENKDKLMRNDLQDFFNVFIMDYCRFNIGYEEINDIKSFAELFEESGVYAEDFLNLLPPHYKIPKRWKVDDTIYIRGKIVSLASNCLEDANADFLDLTDIEHIYHYALSEAYVNTIFLSNKLKEIQNKAFSECWFLSSVHYRGDESDPILEDIRAAVAKAPNADKINITVE